MTEKDQPWATAVHAGEKRALAVRFDKRRGAGAEFWKNIQAAAAAAAKLPPIGAAIMASSTPLGHIKAALPAAPMKAVVMYSMIMLQPIVLC